MARRRNVHEPTGPRVGPPDRRRHREHEDHDHDHPNPVYIFLLLSVVPLMSAVFYIVQNPRVIISCESSQPLVQVAENFLDERKFSALSKCLKKHPLVLGNEPQLADFDVKHTRRFIFKFNEEGISNFREHRHFSCFSSLFDAVRHPRANAFVMNLLVCEASNDNSPDGVAVGLHLDKTVGIQSSRHFLAHQVNVLYAMVPDDMVGGELHVFPYENGHPKSDVQPSHTVAPQLNRLVTFKGSAYHRVMQFQSKYNATRVSLVLEQYIIPKSYKSRLIVSTFEYRTEKTTT